MKRAFKNLSIKTKIFILFLLILIVTIIGVSYVPYSKWNDLINQRTYESVNSLNKQVTDEIDRFIQDTKYLNKVNKGLIERNIVSMDNERVRENFFINAISSFNSASIYSFSYGTELGEYYGARKNENNAIEVMKNNKETGGHSWYYSVRDGLVGEKISDHGSFDPRTREWYMAAKQLGRPVFSPVYKHFILDDLAMSLSSPIYDDYGQLQGVLGSHVNLGRIASYLEDLVSTNNACAMIVERDSNKIVANCANNAHIKKNENGEFERLTVDEIENKLISEAYGKYKKSGKDIYTVKGEEGTAYISIKEYKDIGLNWIVITSLPESIMTRNLNKSIKIGLLTTLLVIFASSFVFFLTMKKYVAEPIDSLIKTQKDFSRGNLFEREEITRNDEIGKIGKSFNAMADTIYILVNGLEGQVRKRTQELYESKEYLETTLLSVGDGIIATDREGFISVVNPLVERLTGLSMDEMKGRAIEDVLNIYFENSANTCENPVAKVLRLGEKVETCGEPLLLSKEGEYIPIEYTAAPIKDKEGNITGVVIVLRDITNEKEKIDKIKHLSMHDQLTGLYNRWFMNDQIDRLDKTEFLPLTIMVVDINGLKLVNDAFGHEMGDELLMIVSRVLKKAIRPQDIAGRIGGDEFIILLPNTDKNKAEAIKQKIHKDISKQKLDSVIISIAVGYTVKEYIDEDIEAIRVSADNQMYKNKLIHGKTMRNQTIETVLRNINLKYDKEQVHTERVSQYCESIAKEMGFSKEKVEEIKTAGLLHDIGKIVVPPELLNKAENLKDDEFELIKRHPESGYHILKSVDEYINLAEDVLCHHERWDGKGYPQGLKGELIPINARIIAVADAFEAMTAQRAYQKQKTTEEAIAELKRCAGSQFDPEIVGIFINDVLVG